MEILHATPIPSWIVNPATLRIVEGNAAAAHRYGYSQSEFRGMAMCHLFEEFSGELAGTESSRHRQVTKLGEVLEVRVVSQPFSRNGEDLLLVMAIDETEQATREAALQRDEAHMRSLLEHSVDIIYEINPKGFFTFVNAAAKRILGFGADETVNHHFTELIRPDWRKRVVQHYLGQMETGLESTYLEFPCIARDGTEVWIGQHVRTVVSNGAVTGFEAVARDVTDRIALEAALADRRDAALLAARQKSEFLANISHEIRTPMNGVIGMLGILLDSKLDDDQRDLADTARSSAQSLLSLINDILDFSKMEAQKLQLEKADFDLRDSIQSVVDVLAANARKKSLEIGSAIDADVPRSLSGDEGRLRQILLNLLGNAIKFTESGGAVIRVSRASASEGSVQLLFRVTDTGIGMSPEASGSIFRPFVQAETSTTHRFGGTGLGLAISKQLVTMMRGEIGVETEPGQGSTFWFTATFDARPEAAAPEPSEAIRALLVDDSATGRNLLSLQLSAWEVANDVASDSTEALAKLREAANAGTPYNVVVSDFQMPNIDGIMLARLVKAQPQFGSPRFILVSGTAPTEVESATLAEKGVSVWLTKPIKQRQLQAAVLGKPVAQARVERPALAGPSKSGRILVADDNAVNQKVTLRQLKKLGCFADAVANGREAIEALDSVSYDLVLMDCHMPKMDGFEATAKIRDTEQGGRRLPIVALTASVQQEDRDRCLAAGMDDFLAKPVSERELTRVLERWLPDSAFDPKAIQNLQSLAGDDASFMREVMSSYIETGDEVIAAMEAGDSGEFGRLAHALAGSSRNVGAMRLADLCSAAENDARQDREAARGKYFDSIRAAYAAVRREIAGKDAAA